MKIHPTTKVRWLSLALKGNYVPEDFNFEEIVRNMRHKAHEINIG